MSRTPGRMKCTKGNEPWFFLFSKERKQNSFFYLINHYLSFFQLDFFTADF
ncbi:hypothetical protein BCBMB205_05410 [Bacillus sp. CN2]|nr:hypothetical protein BCBMB205_05410 [Bacillus velezensis]ARZ56866.1 hypothetical protein BAGQ_0604 [Bacillus velezensis]GFR56481.1 hypothetical protein BCBMB205_05410 [Bacillus sp. CN2]